MHTYVYISTIYNSQVLEASQVPLRRSEDIKKKAVVHLHMEYYAAAKKEGNLAFCDSMDGPGEYYAKQNKPLH